MKKKSPSQSGIFTPRALLGLTLCLIGLLLAVVTLAAPKASARRSAAGFGSTVVKPTVIQSLVNGVSDSVRALPPALPTARDFETELPQVKPAREVPANFIDQALQKALATTKNLPGPNAILPTPNVVIPNPNVSFDGMNQSEGCGGCIPPDTTGAVGASQYVQMVNSAFSVYAKNGTRLTGPTPINQLFKNFPVGNVCRDTNDGDPIVVYDQLADRWLLSQFGFPSASTGPYHECVAISQSGDATGSYYIYDFPLSTTKFHDYPHIGLWPDGYYMSTHEFLAPALSYVGAGAIAFERDKMLAGLPAQLVMFDLGHGNTSFGGHLPANLDGYTLPPAGAPNYFMEADNAADLPPSAALRIWKFHVDWATPANSTFGLDTQPNSILPVTDFARPPCSLAGNRAYVSGCVPQLGDPSQLDPIGDRLMYRLAYRNFGDHESLVLTHTVIANATTMQTGPRWYEVRDPGGVPTKAQESTFGPTGMTDLLYRFMGSIAMDRAGDMAIGYSTSSSASFPSIAYTGRLVGDPASTLGPAEVTLQAGGGPQHGEAFAPQTGRWGDYTTMTVDPVDDCTFWYTNEYFGTPVGPTADWQTRIGSFKFPTCTPRPTGLLTGKVTDSANQPIIGAKVTAGGYTAITGNSGVYQFSPLAPGAYTVSASATGYFPSSVPGVTVVNGGSTTQNFALARNLAEPTPTPPPLPVPLRTVNPPSLNDPGSTIATNHYPVTWTPAEVTTGLAGYIVEESTDYVAPLFDNADGSAMPGDAASPWNKGSTTDPWTQNPLYNHSSPFSYFANGEQPVGDFTGIDTSLTLKNPITIPGSVGSARLNFWSRYYNDGDDTGNVEVSTDGGTKWTSLLVLNDAPTVPPANTRMQDLEVDLSAYKGVPMKLRYRFNNGSLIYFLIRTIGWWVDDILIDGATWTQIDTTPANATSTNILNKPNGHYYYRVRGVYSDGSITANSNVQDIVVNAPPPPSLINVKSRKTHTGRGDFNIGLPLTNPSGVECRTGGANGNHKIVFTFANAVSVNGNPKAQVTSGTGTVSNVTVSGAQVTVDLTQVSDAQKIALTLFSVSDGTNTGDISLPIRFILGDVNGTGLVDGNDVSAVQAQTRQLADDNTFYMDVDLSGLIDGNDVSVTQGRTRSGARP